MSDGVSAIQKGAKTKNMKSITTSTTLTKEQKKKNMVKSHKSIFKFTTRTIRYKRRTLKSTNNLCVDTRTGVSWYGFGYMHAFDALL